MKMKVPWWRRVIDFALGGIRSGFGLFSRNGHTKPQNEVAEFPAEEERRVQPEAAPGEPEIIERKNIGPKEARIAEALKEKIAEPETAGPATADIDIVEPPAEPKLAEPKPAEIEAAEAAVSEYKVAEPEVAEIDPSEETIIESVDREPEVLETVEEETEVAQPVVTRTETAAKKMIQTEVVEAVEADTSATEDDVIRKEAGRNEPASLLKSKVESIELAETEPIDAEVNSGIEAEIDAEVAEPAKVESLEPESKVSEVDAAIDADVEVDPIAESSEPEVAEPEVTELKLSNLEIAEPEIPELIMNDSETAEADVKEHESQSKNHQIAEPAADVNQDPTEPENSNEEAETLMRPSPQFEAVAPNPDPAEEPTPIPETAPADQSAEEKLAGEQQIAPSVEQPATEETVTSATPDAASVLAAEEVKSPEPPAPAPASEPVQQSLPLPEPTQEQKTAEKVAAMLKARGQEADDSPFSVIVSQVYDGPLDLLLDLIRKQDIDIYDIPIAKITAQFLAYVDRLRATDMDVAGEFIYTAALLIHIKSKMLLPRAPAGPDDATDDPRRELVERLLEHERFKNAAQMLHERQMLEAASWTNPGVREFREDEAAEPEIAADTTDLVRIFREILERARNRPILNLQEDTVTVGQMIQFLARRLTMEDRPVALRRLLSHTNSERALIAMFLALLEMVRLQAILLRQDRQFSEIFIKKHTGFEAAMNQGLADARDDWR